MVERFLGFSLSLMVAVYCILIFLSFSLINHISPTLSLWPKPVCLNCNKPGQSVMSLLQAIPSNYTMHLPLACISWSLGTTPTHIPPAPGTWRGAEALGVKGDRDCKFTFAQPYFWSMGICWSWGQNEQVVLESIRFVKYRCDNTTATTKEFTTGSVAAVAY